MWNWNQFKQLPRICELPPAEQSRQFFIYQSDMIYESRMNYNINSSVSSGGHMKDDGNHYVENGFMDDYFE